MEFLPELVSSLSLGSSSPKDSNEFSEKVVQQVKSNNSKISTIFPQLIEQVKSSSKSTEPVVFALEAIDNLFSELPVITEPWLASNLDPIFDCSNHKQIPIREASEKLLRNFVTKLNPHAIREILPSLFKASVPGAPWQGRVLALKLISLLSEHAPIQLSNSLPLIIPHVTASMNEPKKEVTAAAHEAMTNACNVIGNRDIEHMTSKIVHCISNPKDVPEIMHSLAGVTFVQSVEASALAMVVPLLIRGLRSNLTATRRQSSVIIDNMSQLVDHAIDAEPFLPTLLPALEFAAENMSNPEARTVAERALKRLKSLNEQCEYHKAHTKGVDFETIKKLIEEKTKATSKHDVEVSHLAHLASSLLYCRIVDKAEWDELLPYVEVINKNQAAANLDLIREKCAEMIVTNDDEEDDIDASELLCNCQFTLAYGTKILLHNTTMKLRRGAKYGLLGSNESGKTTLMRSIANGSVEGFPDPSVVRTVFVEADILGELSHLSCVDYILQDPRLKGIPREEVLRVMATVGFTEDGKAKPTHPVSSLSGGWRMKLALARAMLQKADILLLDEPTNHLDVINVAWVKNYINSLKNVTAIMVSHDSGFLNDCCTDILHINSLKLHHYKGNLDAFIKKHPEAKAYFSIKETKLKFHFPQPGPIEGVKSRSKALMKMSHCYFTYPGNDKPTLYDITIQVSMASRVGCVGENGAGKSTMIKVLTGEVVPQVGEVWKHPNCRVAYVAQHAFHHIENHLNKTPNEYIRWRYETGDDRESLVKLSMVFTEEEEKLKKEPFEVTWVNEKDGKITKANKVVVSLTGNRREAKGREYEYECKFKDESEMFLPFRTLQRRGWEKACKAIDARIAQRSGLQLRALSSANVEKHLGDCGLAPEFATHYRIGALSGGQKVKVVLAAAMWNQPHIIILDEPTNYLDRESLGALAGAIEEYQGGVVIISHNNEFVSQLCPEEWVMENGHLTTRGEVGWMSRQDDKIADTAQPITSMVDALGNVTEIEAPKKKLTKRDEKALIKAIQKKIKGGIELDEDEFNLAVEHELL